MISIGLWGCGGMGSMLAAAVTSSRLGVVRAGFDSNWERCQEAANAIDFEAVSTENELLDRKSLDALIIALPGYLHREAAVRAAQAEKHIFLEKPMAFGVPACEEINEAVREAGVTLMVGHVLRYYEPFRSIIGWTRERRFGRLLQVDIIRAEHDYLSLADWKRNRRLSGGYLYEVGAHDLDWMRCLIGEPLSVEAVVEKVLPSEHEIEDRVSVKLKFGDGTAGSFLGGTVIDPQEYSFRLQYERAILNSEDAFNPQALTVEGNVPWRQSFNADDPVELEVRQWLESLIQGRPMPITGEDALRTVALIDAAYLSARWDEGYNDVMDSSNVL